MPDTVTTLIMDLTEEEMEEVIRALGERSWTKINQADALRQAYKQTGEQILENIASEYQATAELNQEIIRKLQKARKGHLT